METKTIGVVGKKNEDLVCLIEIPFLVGFVVSLVVYSLFVEAYFTGAPRHLVILTALMIALLPLLSKEITYIHEVLHQREATRFGYNTTLILEKKKRKDVAKKRELKKVNGFCDFEEGVAFDPNHLLPIYMAPLKFLLLGFLFTLLLIGVFLLLNVKIAVVFALSYLLLLIGWKLRGCLGDIVAFRDIRKVKDRIIHVYYKDYAFHMEVEKQRTVLRCRNNSSALGMAGENRVGKE